jgi:putative redox protein
MRENVQSCEVEIDGVRADTDPKVYTKIHLHFIVSGHGLKAKKAEEAVKMSAEKYCSASIMLGAMAEVSHDVEVIDLDAQ